MKKILGFLLGVMIGCAFMIPILGLQKQNDKLKKENQELMFTNLTVFMLKSVTL